ncbi:MAG: dihydrofolate reductase [Oscillospiraceae bacterium]|nr:dihydrofolate reductase [Oscillospiraceae bacterium]
MKFIVAIDINRGIGFNGNLLLKIPEDMSFFKKTTLGNIIVMGRNTYESLPNKAPLFGRINVILTRNKDINPDGFITFYTEKSLREYLEKEILKDIFVIGGEQIYNIFQKDFTEGYVTQIDYSFNADCFFPDIFKDGNMLLDETISTGVYKNIEYKIEKYVNKKTNKC